MREINLLPKKRQQEIRDEAILHGLYLVFWASLVSFALVFLAQIGTKLYLENELNSIQSQIEQLKSQVDKKENAQIKDQIKGINSRIADYKNLASAAPKWSKMLKAFAVLPPPDVVISSLMVDSGTKSVAINGFAPTRESVIKLYENIKADSEHFYNVNYPLENVVKPSNVSFHFTFFIKEDLLK